MVHYYEGGLTWWRVEYKLWNVKTAHGRSTTLEPEGGGATAWEKMFPRAGSFLGYNANWKKTSNLYKKLIKSGFNVFVGIFESVQWKPLPEKRGDQENYCNKKTIDDTALLKIHRNE